MATKFDLHRKYAWFGDSLTGRQASGHGGSLLRRLRGSINKVVARGLNWSSTGPEISGIHLRPLCRIHYPQPARISESANHLERRVEVGMIMLALGLGYKYPYSIC